MRPLDIEEIKRIVATTSDKTNIMVGCDSQVRKKQGKKYATYAKVVIIHVDGNKGCMVFGDVVTEMDYGNLRQRLMREVGLAIEVATELVDHVGERGFQIHLDIASDPTQKSHVAMKEAIGWVRGMFGFDPQVKPESLASSHAADHFVRI